MILVDSHCHIDFDPLSADIPGLLARADANEVGYMLVVAVNLEDYPRIKKLVASDARLFSSVGVHPNQTDCHDPETDELVALADDANVIAIGETGLDYFRSDGDLDWQRARFEVHIEAAKRCGKPLIIHTRSASDDTMRILEQCHAGDVGGVMHCFAEDWSVAKRALDIGFYISFSGIVTFKNAGSLRDVAGKVPIDRMLVETDAPYLAPVPFRGKLNEPSLVRHTAQAIADIRGQTLSEVAQKTTENFFSLFTAAVR